MHTKVDVYDKSLIADEYGTFDEDLVPKYRQLTFTMVEQRKMEEVVQGRDQARLEVRGYITHPHLDIDVGDVLFGHGHPFKDDLLKVDEAYNVIKNRWEIRATRVR